MNLLLEIHDNDIGGTTDFSVGLKPRKATRAVLRRGDGKIALLFVSNEGYYKLPDGGIEGDENTQSALLREVEEEVGCTGVIDGELGIVLEYRQLFEQIQINYSFVMTTRATEFNPAFTQKELSKGFELVWVTPMESLKKIIGANCVSYESKYIQKRDGRIMQEYIDMRL